jgi:hypothetical protein
VVTSFNVAETTDVGNVVDGKATTKAKWLTSSSTNIKRTTACRLIDYDNDSDVASVSPQVNISKKKNISSNKRPSYPRRPLNSTVPKPKKIKREKDDWLINSRHEDAKWW